MSYGVDLETWESLTGSFSIFSDSYRIQVADLLFLIIGFSNEAVVPPVNSCISKIFVGRYWPGLELALWHSDSRERWGLLALFGNQPYEDNIEGAEGDSRKWEGCC